MLSTLPFPGQATNTGAGIQACKELLETSTSGYPQILLLFSDGLPNRPSPGARQDTEAKANATKMAGITLVPAIVNSGNADFSFLEKLASPGVKVFEVNDFNNIDQLVAQLTKDIFCANAVTQRTIPSMMR